RALMTMMATSRRNDPLRGSAPVAPSLVVPSGCAASGVTRILSHFLEVNIECCPPRASSREASTVVARTRAATSVAALVENAARPWLVRRRATTRSLGDEVALLLDLRLLAAQLAEVVQLGATDVTAGDD